MSSSLTGVSESAPNFRGSSYSQNTNNLRVRASYRSRSTGLYEGHMFQGIGGGVDETALSPRSNHILYIPSEAPPPYSISSYPSSLFLSLPWLCLSPNCSWSGKYASGWKVAGHVKWRATSESTPSRTQSIHGEYFFYVLMRPLRQPVYRLVKSRAARDRNLFRVEWALNLLKQVVIK